MYRLLIFADDGNQRKILTIGGGGTQIYRKRHS